MMPAMVYLLCIVTCMTCVALLWRAYKRTTARLLLWCCLCFIGLTLNNVFLFVDVIILPEINLALYRMIPALLGVSLLLYGMIWERR